VIVAYPPFSGYSPTGGLGSGGGGLVASIGQFSDSTDQTLVANTPYTVKFNTTDYSSGGISVVDPGTGPTRLTVTTTGIYRFDVSLQVLHTGGVGTVFYIWGQINGTNLANSASSIEMGNNNNRTLPYVPLLVPLNAGQYFEWVVMSSGANTTLEHFPAVVGPPAIPAIPSVIAGVYRLA
jgi:hypothetical protein